MVWIIGQHLEFFFRFFDKTRIKTSLCENTVVTEIMNSKVFKMYSVVAETCKISLSMQCNMLHLLIWELRALSAKVNLHFRWLTCQEGTLLPVKRRAPSPQAAGQHTFHTMQRHNTKNSKQIFSEKELRGLSPQFPNSWVCERFIYSHNRPAYSSAGKICGQILGIYNLLTDTSMWRFGRRPRNSFSGNT